MFDREGRDGLKSCTLFFLDLEALDALDVLDRTSGRMGEDSLEPNGDCATELDADESLVG
jgi:hypothetical protein